MIKKDFITDKLGMYAFPDNNIVVKGDVSSTPITMKYLNRGTTLYTTADGTTGVLPNGRDINLPSNTVLEMQYAQMGAQVNPQQQQQQQLMQLISMYCQVVGGGDESCAQKVAKSVQQNPQKMVQQMIAAVQEAQQQQPAMGGEEQMARDGGCIDCQEQFPQAQNLNWFYKAQGGEAFPQANMYPESWVGYTGTQYAFGGSTEVFPQAQTYLPYDRPGETRLNGMFQKGGTLYDYVKSMGLDPSYQSRKQIFSRFFDEPYTGSAEQNMYLLDALQSGKISLAEKPKLGAVDYSRMEGAGKRSVLPKAKEAQKESSKRAIPQSGVIVDKRTGEAVVLGSSDAITFPVLTGRNVEGNINTYTLDELTPERMTTPTGYYMLEDKNVEGATPYTGEFEGNVGKWLNPISAYGEQAPLARNLVMHGTFNPKVRNPLYTASPEERNVSMGCVNCRPTDFQHMMGTLGGPDTVMVVDTKKPQDKQLFQEAKKQAEIINRSKQYSVVATQPRGGTSFLEYGGEADLESIYRVMKAGGLNKNPKKKKASEETFDQYMMRMGGLPKHQAYLSEVDLNAWQRFRSGVKNMFTKDSNNQGIRINNQSSNQNQALPHNAKWLNNPGNTQPGAYNQLGVQSGYVPEGRYDLLPGTSPLGTSPLGAGQSDEGPGYDQTYGDYFPTVRLDEKGNVIPPGLNQTQQPTNRPATQVTTPSNKYMPSMMRGYQKGFGVTRLLGSKAGAVFGLLGAAGSFADMFRGGKDKFKYIDDSGVKTKLKGQEARDAAMKYFDDIYPPQNTKEYGGMYYQPGGEYGMFISAEDQRELERQKAFSRSGRLAGFADAAEINRLKELEEEQKRRSGISGLNAPSITSATKTPGGGPQGSLNQPGFVPQTTIGNFPSGMYPLSPLSNQGLPAARTGGSILDYFEDGGTYDLDDMTPDEREDLIRKIYAAGGSVEFI